jgi:hypothetical protein
MNYSYLKITHSKTMGLKTRNCRNLMVSSRIRRQVMAENLDKIWLQLRRHATIEKDPNKLWQLATDLKKAEQPLETGSQRTGV